jgi:hypothetical protein
MFIARPGWRHRLQDGLRIQRRELEDRLIAGLQERVLPEEFNDYVICGLAASSKRILRRSSRETTVIRKPGRVQFLDMFSTWRVELIQLPRLSRSARSAFA